MGFHVTSLHSLPVGPIRYFVHVLDMSGGAHGKWIDGNLGKLAAHFEANAGLVTGPSDFSQELYLFLSRHLKGGFSEVERVLLDFTCLIISDGHLAHTQRPVFLIPLASQNEASEEFVESMLTKVANALTTGSLTQLMKNLGATEFQLSEIKGGFWICTLRKANEVLHLKPNVAGFGINLNAAIEQILGPSQRTI